MLSGGSRISQRKYHSQRWTPAYHLATFSWKLHEIEENFLCRSTSDCMHLTNTTRTYIIHTWWADSKTSLASLPVLSKRCFIYGQKCTYSVSMLTFIIMDQTFVLLECTWMELQGHLSSYLGSSIFSTKFETKSIQLDYTTDLPLHHLPYPYDTQARVCVYEVYTGREREKQVWC